MKLKLILLSLLITLSLSAEPSRWVVMKNNHIVNPDVFMLKLRVCKSGYLMHALIMTNRKTLERKTEFAQIYEYDSLGVYPNRRVLCDGEI